MKADGKLKVGRRSGSDVVCTTNGPDRRPTLQKIMLLFTREIEAIARTAVQTELTSLLPGAAAQSFGLEG